MKLSLALPVKPYHLNQAYGNNPLNSDGTPYYARFKDSFGNPMQGHMGADLQASHGEPVFAPIDGVAKYEVDDHGGDGVIVRTNVSFDYKDGSAWFNLIHWHMCAKDDAQFPIQIPTDGAWYPVKKGQLLGYADNTGAPFESSGDHLHWGAAPTDSNNVLLEPGNGFNGCIDPMQFWDGTFASDVALAPVIQGVISTATGIVSSINSSPISISDKETLLSEIEKVVELIKSLI